MITMLGFNESVWPWASRHRKCGGHIMSLVAFTTGSRGSKRVVNAQVWTYRMDQHMLPWCCRADGSHCTVHVDQDAREA